MVDIKPMPYTEKYKRVLGSIEHDEYVAEFVERHLGQPVADEYRMERDSGLDPIPDGASPEEKYETAYRNWMKMAGTAFGFVRRRMGEEGIDHMIAAGAQRLKEMNADPSLYVLGLVRAFSPGLAFEMVAKKSAYELQYLTPYTLDALSRERAVLSIPRCKILDYPDSEDTCLIGCQREYPQWFAEQLKVRMAFERHDHSCTLTLTPLH